MARGTATDDTGQGHETDAIATVIGTGETTEPVAATEEIAAGDPDQTMAETADETTTAIADARTTTALWTDPQGGVKTMTGVCFPFPICSSMHIY
jgi:hypothetical protein